MAAEGNLILHRFPAAITMPNLSPFVIKVETFFRMAGIKYDIDTKKPTGPKGKSPWVTYNNKDIPDSQFIVEYFKKEKKLDLNNGYNEAEIAISDSVRIMLEEHAFWMLALWRFVDGLQDLPSAQKLPAPLWAVKLLIGRKIVSRSKAQGIGLHSPKEQRELAERDLRNASKILGNKQFFLGDLPCENDAAIFGILSQFLWGLPNSPYQKLITEELINLKEYCERMKDKYWPDWDECTSKPDKK